MDDLGWVLAGCMFVFIMVDTFVLRAKRKK